MASPAPASADATSSQTNRYARRHPAKQVQRGYCGVAEAAIYLDITEKTLRKMIARGELAAYRINPRIIKIKLADLDALGQRIGSGA